MRIIENEATEVVDARLLHEYFLYKDSFFKKKTEIILGVFDLKFNSEGLDDLMDLSDISLDIEKYGGVLSGGLDGGFDSVGWKAFSEINKDAYYELQFADISNDMGGVDDFFDVNPVLESMDGLSEKGVLKRERRDLEDDIRISRLLALWELTYTNLDPVDTFSIDVLRGLIFTYLVSGVTVPASLQVAVSSSVFNDVKKAVYDFRNLDEAFVDNITGVEFDDKYVNSHNAFLDRRVANIGKSRSGEAITLQKKRESIIRQCNLLFLEEGGVRSLVLRILGRFCSLGADWPDY